MEYLSWLPSTVFVLALLFLALMLVVGTASVWPTTWRSKLHQAGTDEAQRRLGRRSTATEADHFATMRLIGSDPKSAAPEGDAALLDAIAIMTGTTTADRARIETRLNRRRARLEQRALERQVRLVAGVPSLRTASYLWVACRAFNSTAFAISGLCWFLPRALPYLVKVNGKHLTTATVGGIYLGIFAAGFSHVESRNDPTMEWLAFVGDVAQIVAIAVIISNVFRLFKLYLVAQFGDVRQWTARGTILGFLTLTLVSTMLYLTFSGTFRRWQQALLAGAQQVHLNPQAERWIGGLLMLVVLAYMMRNAWTRTRAKTLILSRRIYSAAGLLGLVIASAFMLLFLLNVPFANIDGLLLAGAPIVLTVFAGFVVSIWEWAQKHRAIVRAGWKVKRKGFRLWALIAWSATAAILQVTAGLVERTSPLAQGSIPFQIVNTLYFLLTMATLLLFWPGVVISALFVRRVNIAYQELEYLQASQHPLLAPEE